MPRKISRKLARVRGLTRYFTGKTCKRGHVAERMTCNSHCTECLLLRQRSPRGREWHRKACRTYGHTPKGRETVWRYTQTERGREKGRRFARTPKGREGKRRNRLPGTRSYETQRRYMAGPQRAWRNEYYRKRRLEKIEAEYRAHPTQQNWTRVQNLIARRIRDGH
jgi:hypothetical protein